MTDKFSGRKAKIINKSFPELLQDLEMVWQRQDKQLAFDQLMNRMKRGLVAVEEINRIPERWRLIAFERGFIKLDEHGGWVPRQTNANHYTTPWQDQRHVENRVKQRMFMRQMLMSAPNTMAA